MGSCAAPSAKGDDKFITTDYLQQCPIPSGVVPSFFFNHQLACPEISMSWQKQVLLNYTPM
uniref:hypothetical protein n=1 Tax=Salmonella enterica TaxID=28901 RepID=UPI00155DBF3C|nr:hypothetical protein [Salmonella enterica]